MNEKIQAILLRIVLDLKKLKWQPHPDWELTLKSEKHVPLVKYVQVQGSMGDEEWDDHIETHLDLKLSSEDELTYFPEFTIFASIYIDGAQTKDVAYTMQSDVAFMDSDYRDVAKSKLAAAKIDRLTESHIESEYAEYVSDNSEAIEDYKKAGDDEPYDR